MNAKGRRAWALVAGGALVLSLTGCSLLPTEQQPLAPPLVKPVTVPYQTATVTRGSIENDVTGTANFVALTQINLNFPNPTGRISQILCHAGQRVKKGQVLLTTDTSDLQFQLQEAQIQLQKDQLSVQQLEAQKADKYQIEAAQLDVKSDQLKVDYLNKQIANGTLVSPIDGIITKMTSHNIGDTVQPYENLVSVADPHQLQLKYDSADGTGLSSVADGMPVEVSYHGQSYQGTVAQNTTDPNTGSYLLFISLSQLPPDAKMGDSADFKIVTQKKKSTLIIPLGALGTDFGDTYVRVLDGKAVQQVSVQTGIQTATEVEILKGVKAGEKVILH